MKRIVIIGAGSVVFSKQLMIDILHFEELSDCCFCLEDINPERLGMTEKVARMFIEQTKSKATVELFNNIPNAVKGADFVINLVQVGGFESTKIDFAIPAKYGMKQTIADSMGVGGMMRALRTMPVMDEICQSMLRECPQAILLNYTNPMGMLSQYVLTKYPDIHYVGLCHSVQTTSKQLALYMNVPYDQLNYKVAGINHQAWFLELSQNGKDLYPILREISAKRKADPSFVPEHLYAYKGNDAWFRENFKNSAAETFEMDLVRFEIFRRLGFYVTESSEHNAEYCPYFLKDESLIKEYKIPVNEYIRRCEICLKEFETVKNTINSGKELHVDTSQEYAGFILHSVTSGEKGEINGNVLNTGLIPNLPNGCCVEVPCLVDRNGIQPTYVGVLPEQCAAYNRVSLNSQILTVEAALKKDRSLLYQAALMDPCAYSQVRFDQIDKMVDELLQAHGSIIPFFS